jgi:frataxin-like iron-binding protein CyaY
VGRKKFNNSLQDLVRRIEYNLFDDLLNHIDTKFKIWYGIIINKSSRTQTTIEGNAAYILWWCAAKYGGYKHADLVFV